MNNEGGATARYPVVEIVFKELHFAENPGEGWTHRKQGEYEEYTLQWNPGSDIVVHPGYPVELPPLHFRSNTVVGINTKRKFVQSGSKMKLKVRVVADGDTEQKPKWIEVGAHWE